MKSDCVDLESVSHCHNCGAAVDYNYCAVCGQGTVLHVPSASEFIHEFVGHYIALEGRLWKTLYFLFFRPGFLTAEYIAGRRVRYVEPLRVYLTFSILFFALFKLTGPTIANFDDVAGTPGSAATVQAAPAPDKDDRVKLKSGGALVAQMDKDGGTDSLVIFGSPELTRKARDFFNKPGAERNRILTTAFFGYVPYAMFLMMPLFALYLKLLYLGSGRRYGEHLLFALHTNAFAFCMLSLFILTARLDIGLLKFALIVWLVYYLPTAMRRVYGGSRWATGLRWLTLAFCHVVSIFAAIVSAFGVAVFS